MIKNDNLLVILDLENYKIIIEPAYHAVEEFENDLFICTLEEYKSVVNAEGFIILPPGNYSEIWIESDELIGAEKANGTKVFYNQEGQQAAMN